MIANPDNGLHVTGMTTELQFLPLRIGTPGTMVNMASAINTAVNMFCLFRSDRRPLVINVSWGMGDHERLRMALNNAVAEGAVVVKSAGNTSGGDVTYVDDTVAAAGLLVAHVTKRPVKTFPAWS